MRKYVLLMIIPTLLAGCVAHVTPEGTYIEPLPATIVVGPPAVVAPPPHVHFRALPPVVMVPDRRTYFYNNMYYYHWDGEWYFGERERGPWHKLPREYYPKQYKQRQKHERGYER